MRAALAGCMAALLAACAQHDVALQPGDEVVLAAANAGNPTAALDPRDGTRYIVWVETRDSLSDVYLSRGDAGQAVRVNDLPGDAAAHDQAPPQVAVGPDGTVYVVWQNNTHIPGRRFPASNLRFARSTDGGHTFEPAIFVNDDALGLPSSHTFHDIAVADDGAIYVSWIDGRERARVEAERKASGAAHGGHGGHASHGMHDPTLPGSEVRVARSTDGGRSFGANVVAAADVCPCCRTSVVADDSGRVFVSYRLSTDNIRDIAVVTSADGAQSFAAPVTVHRDGWEIDGCPHAGASLALDGDGRLHVAWYTGAEQRQGIWHAVSSDGARTFGAPQPVQGGDWVPVSQVKLAAGRDGSVWIGWDDRREDTSAVRVARVGRRGIAAAHSVSGEHPALAAGEDVMLVWRTADGSAHALALSPR